MQSNQMTVSLGALLTGLSGAGVNAERLGAGGEGDFLDTFEARLRELLSEQGLDLESLDPAAANALQAQLAQWMPPAQMPSLPLAAALPAGQSGLKASASGGIEAAAQGPLVSQPALQLQLFGMDGASLDEALTRLKESAEGRDLLGQLGRLGAAASEGGASLDEALTRLKESAEGRDLLGQLGRLGAAASEGGASLDEALTRLAALESSSVDQPPAFSGSLPGGRDPLGTTVSSGALGESVLRDLAARPGPEALDATCLSQGEAGAEHILEGLDSAADGLVQVGATLSSGRATDGAGTVARALVFDLRELLQPGGAQRLAEQIQWMARAGEDMAELKLHPPSLGALDVRIAMEGDKTHVQFLSANPVVREVLEAALPRLREALGQDNLMLGDASVSDYPSNAGGDAGGQGQEGRGGGFWAGTDGADEEVPVALADHTLSVLARRLDLFV